MTKIHLPTEIKLAIAESLAASSNPSSLVPLSLASREWERCVTPLMGSHITLRLGPAEKVKQYGNYRLGRLSADITRRWIPRHLAQIKRVSIRSTACPANYELNLLEDLLPLLSPIHSIVTELDDENFAMYRDELLPRYIAVLSTCAFEVKSLSVKLSETPADVYLATLIGAAIVCTELKLDLSSYTGAEEILRLAVQLPQLKHLTIELGAVDFALPVGPWDLTSLSVRFRQSGSLTMTESVRELLFSQSRSLQHLSLECARHVPQTPEEVFVSLFRRVLIEPPIQADVDFARLESEYMNLDAVATFISAVTDAKQCPFLKKVSLRVSYDEYQSEGLHEYLEVVLAFVKDVSAHQPLRLDLALENILPAWALRVRSELRNYCRKQGVEPVFS